MQIDEAIAQQLKSLGFGNLQGEVNEHIFIRHEPPTPDDVITVFADGGGPFLRQVTEGHALTIRTRNVSPDLAVIEARRIHEALHDTSGLFGSILFGRIFADTPPIPLGWDPTPKNKGRWLVTQSYTALVKRFTTP